MVSSKSRLKKASSDGVSILDTKEISGFTFCEAGEVVPEFLEPPSFDFWSMFSLQRFKCWQRQCQSGGVRSTGQANCRNHESTLANYVTTKIRKSASLPYEVIHQDITPTWQRRPGCWSFAQRSRQPQQLSCRRQSARRGRRYHRKGQISRPYAAPLETCAPFPERETST